MDSAQRARRGLGIFFLVLVLASAPLEMQIAKHGMEVSSYIPLVWVPALASVVARLALREGFADISFRFDRRVLGATLLGLVYPILVSIPGFALAWMTGVAKFEPASMHPLGFPIPGDSPSERFAIGALIAVTVAPLAMGILALGEEIGWRGYMLTRLIDARIPHPILVSGLVWGLWHAPLILSGRYLEGSNPFLAFSLFVVTLCGLSWFDCRMRLDTGSVWPAVMMHAAWNAIFVAFFGASTQGEQATLWTGEGGIFGVISTVVVTAALLRLRRRPPPSLERRAGALPRTPAGLSAPAPGPGPALD